MTAPEGFSVDARSMFELLRSGLLARVREWLRSRDNAAEIAFDPGKSLIEHGLGSVDQIELYETLETWAHQRFPAELIWECPTVDDMVHAIAEALNPAPARR